MPSTAAAVPGDPVTPDTVRALAALAGIALPEADVAPVALLLAGQAATVAPLLALVLDEQPSALDLDPRWP